MEIVIEEKRPARHKDEAETGQRRDCMVQRAHKNPRSEGGGGDHFCQSCSENRGLLLMVDWWPAGGQFQEMCGKGGGKE